MAYIYYNVRVKQVTIQDLYLHTLCHYVTSGGPRVHVMYVYCAFWARHCQLRPGACMNYV